MKDRFWILLAVGFFLQLLGRHLYVNETELPFGLTHIHIMISGVVIFTMGSIQYARSKGRLWTWGLFGIILPFFLIVVLIPRRN
jgi:hypothetical protein